MNTDLKFRPELFLRTPAYSFAGYDPARLPGVLQRADFRTAIYLASPEFYRVLETAGFNYGRLAAKAQFTLKKYYNRMCFRPVPFGAFAAFSLVPWSAPGALQLGGSEDLALHLTTDLSYGQLPSPDDLLLPAPTLYRFGKSFRYCRTQRPAAGPFTFSIDELDAERLTVDLFRRLRGKPQRFRDLADWVAQETGSRSEGAASDFIRDLCEEEVLLPVGGTRVIGAPQDQAVTTPAAFRPLADDLGQGLYAITGRPYHSGSPGADLQAELSAAAEALRRLAVPQPNPVLRQFIRDFKTRFDRRRVPLLEALDPDAGLAYGAGYAGPAALPWLPEAGAATRQQPELNWNRVRQLLLDRWPGAAGPGGISLDAAALARLPAAAGLTAPSLSVQFRKTCDGLLLEEAGGATATALLGRFTLFSPEVRQLCREIAAAEATANPGVLFADLEFLVQQGVDNVNRRQPVYPHTVVLNVPRQNQDRHLPVSDLWLSVENDELILTSDSLKRRIMPRLASAYNYHRTALPLLALLGDLQFQGLSQRWTLDLENLLPGLAWYPRVSYGDTILTTAKWRLTPADRAALDVDDTAVCTAVKALRKRLHLPQWVTLGTGDQQLVFDLGQPEDRSFFAACLKKEKAATLREYLLPDRSVRGGGAPLAGQFIATLYHQQPVYFPAQAVRAERTRETRRFLPGDDWLYLKIYCRPEQTDRLLTGLISPFIKKYRARLLTWFFIRYQDPHPHLRLRLRLRSGDPGHLLALFRQQLKKSGLGPLVSDLQVAAYERELERYQPRFMNAVEAVFAGSSDAVLAGLEQTGPAPEGRLTAALPQVARMLRSFLPDVRRQAAFCQACAAALLSEHPDPRQLSYQLDLEYRRLAPAWDQQLTDPVPSRLTRHLLAALDTLRERLAARPEPEQHEMLGNLVHMHVNRLFSDHQREQELAIYWFLGKRLASEIARAKHDYK